MSDVVLLPFPLTWLWGSGKYAPSSANIPVDDKAVPASDKTQSASDTTKLASDTVRPTSTTAQLDSETTQSTSDTPKSTSETTIPVSSATKSTSKGSASICSTPTKKVEFKAGVVSIPEEVKTLCKQIRGCRRHHYNNLPVRMELRRMIPEHFNNANGTLKSGSPLHKVVWGYEIIQQGGVVVSKRQESR